MRIDSITIENYKCFANSGEIRLFPGINVIVGKNDAGKSAVTEAVSLSFGDKPHRSSVSVPVAGSATPVRSVVNLSYQVSSQELKLWAAQQKEIRLYATQTTHSEALARFMRALDYGQCFNSKWMGNDENCGGQLEMVGGPLNGSLAFYRNKAYPSSYSFELVSIVGQAEKAELGFMLSERMKSLTYVFKAERMNVGECQFEGKKQLKPNASNLADVINQLISSDQHKYQIFMRHVRTVFPHIAHVTSYLIPGTTSGRLAVTTGSLDAERSDLAVPLSDSGTGISQVLAMLYVIVTADWPQIIVIDEPQSFLHPGALRKLFEILLLYPHHQYIVTTHSPIALNSASNVLLLQRDVTGSSVRQIETNANQDLSLFLTEIGARLSDVFGADSMLWVEGRTEEICFPIILRKLANMRLLGLSILGVVSTDELNGKHATRIYEIYEKICGGTTLMPPTIGFIFDQEGKSEKDRADLDRRSRGLTHWLPARMYENFLIEIDPITTVINKEDTLREKPVLRSEVEAWLQAEGGNDQYFIAKPGLPYLSEGWFQAVDGGRLLRDLFNDLTEARVSYDKVRHGEVLTDILAQNPSERMNKLAGFLTAIIDRSR